MQDVKEKLGRSDVQHGPFSDRVFLMKLDEADFPGIIGQLDDLAGARQYTKIFAMVPVHTQEAFAADGYATEARVPGFFRGEADGYFMGKYLDESRRVEKRAELVKDVVAIAQAKKSPHADISLEPGFAWRTTTAEDAPQMAEVFETVFGSYPVPVFNPEYLRAQMAQGQLYFGIWEGDKLVSLASPYIDDEDLNGELTDFATLKTFRGKGFAGFLMRKMEEEMAQRGIKT
ncbi:MAG: putative beta-lysine N-acetyltransferase, partial [Desulfuromonadales bacterium]|nr:putative beta-lysine N-acetyltransferase [Desulfuromonadales bacterium]NIS41078.1 putative beta-lysine N-acetyltransferase [Desulfuromonadales bacterium]